MSAQLQTFTHKGDKIAFRSYDAEGAKREPAGGERTLVLIHGLLMNSQMFDRLGPAMAARGFHVHCIDLLGHGGSDAPSEQSSYAMTAFAEQVVALLDHLKIERAVIGGTSLGANVSLEVAAAHPERVRALFIEMPVLDNALTACAVAFTPVLVASTVGAPVLRGVSAITRRIPRSNYLADIFLDWLRRDPRSSVLVLQGLLLGRTCPPGFERREIEAEALVVGHPSDPVHPFSDSDQLVEEMANARLIDANSIVEWRLSPERLDEELAAFLFELERAGGDVTAAA